MKTNCYRGIVYGCGGCPLPCKAESSIKETFAGIRGWESMELIIDVHCSCGEYSEFKKEKSNDIFECSCGKKYKIVAGVEIYLLDNAII